MWQDQMIGQIGTALIEDPAVRALFLGGSFGKGQADRYSDIDLIAVVSPADQAQFNAQWKDRLQSIAPIVFWNELTTGDHVFNAITDQWQRIDLVTTDAEAMRRRGQDSLKPVFDKDGLLGTLPETIPWPGPSKGHVSHLIHEFIRVLGLFGVGAGREEYLTCVAGVDLLRMLLYNLLKEEVEVADKGGMLAWSRLLSREQLAALESIPAAAPTRQSLIEANLACAKAFLPRARRMAERLDIAWPQPFEDATWGYLKREAGIEKPASIG
jgi:hypothetical protein